MSHAEKEVITGHVRSMTPESPVPPFENVRDRADRITKRRRALAATAATALLVPVVVVAVGARGGDESRSDMIVAATAAATNPLADTSAQDVERLATVFPYSSAVTETESYASLKDAVASADLVVVGSLTKPSESSTGSSQDITLHVIEVLKGRETGTNIPFLTRGTATPGLPSPTAIWLLRERTDLTGHYRLINSDGVLVQAAGQVATPGQVRGGRFIPDTNAFTTDVNRFMSMPAIREYISSLS